MKHLIGSFVIWISGWKVSINANIDEISHSVMVAAPHTSNWDFIYAMSCFWKKRIDLRFFIKDGYTKSAMGWFFKWLGAIGVDQKNNNNLVNVAVEKLNSNTKMVILVPAEGTRKYVEKWRSGFYHIAQKADVPISLGFLDYKNKKAGVAKVFKPTGNYNHDMEEIEKVYLAYTGKHPDLYNPKIYIRD